MRHMCGALVGLLFLVGCGGTTGFNGGAASDEAAQSLNKLGPPLIAAESDPSLLDEYACGGGKKVRICHVPPGNPDNRHDICIGRPAVEAHLREHRHGELGDYLGACAGQPSEGGGGSDDGGGSTDEGGGSTDDGGSTGEFESPML